MKRWYGKLLGFFAGLALMRGSPVGALLGLLIGHVFDAGWLRPRRRDSMRDNPYAVFGLGSDASDNEVDLAYRRLIAQCHPDVSSAPPPTSVSRPKPGRARSTSPTIASRRGENSSLEVLLPQIYADERR